MLILSREVAAKWVFTRDFCHEKILKPNSKPDFLECSTIGVTHSDYPNYVTSLFIPKQECTSVTTELDRKSLDLKRMDLMFDEQINASRTQVWFHTHPGNCANPSSTDGETWEEHYVTPEHQFAAMGIIAQKYSDSCTYCKVAYDTVIGQKEEDCKIYIYMDHLDKNIPLEYVYKLESINKSSGMPDIHNGFFGDFSQKHQDWLEEIKDNVTKEISFVKTSVGYTTGNNILNNHKKKQTAKPTVVSPTKKEINSTDSGHGQTKFSPQDLVELLIKSNKNSFNAFNRSNQKAILKERKTSQQQIQAAQRHIKSNEESLQLFDLEFMSEDDEKPFDIVCEKTGQSNFENLDPEIIKHYCMEYCIRPFRFKEMFEEFAQYKKAMK